VEVNRNRLDPPSEGPRDEDLGVCRLIDAIHLRAPAFGARKIRDLRRAEHGIRMSRSPLSSSGFDGLSSDEITFLAAPLPDASGERHRRNRFFNSVHNSQKSSFIRDCTFRTKLNGLDITPWFRPGADLQVANPVLERKDTASPSASEGA